jgi:N-acetylglucosaminyldiphosphoundecaprenol N-acetyl-beta-D-mannosaminyltransferase
LIDRLKILNIWVDVVNREMAQERVRRFLNYGKRPYSIFASNPEKNFSFAKDPQLLETFRMADLLLPDGVGIVWAAKILYGVNLDRVPGAEFIFDICALAAKERYGIFIYGSKEETNKTAVDKLQKQFSDMQVAGRSNGYVSQSEMPDLIDYINKSRAKILFLALGSPKQEKWFSTYHHELEHVKVCQCIGGTLDTIAGNVKRAPEFWQRVSLEWFYRLLIQPSRIRRQKILPLFVTAVLKDKLRQLISEFKLKRLNTPH